MEEARPTTKKTEKEAEAPLDPAPQPAPAAELAPGLVHADASPVRCPFCHEGIAVAAEEWLACEGCLARHHAGCWSESGRCASCGGGRSLARAGVGPTADAWRVRVEARAREAGLPLASLTSLAEGLTPLAASPSYEAIIGVPRWLEVVRVIPGSAPAGSLGAWTNGMLSIAVEADGKSTRVRARIATTPQTSGVYGGLVGGLGGGLGGGGAGVITMLFGTHVLLFWVGGMLGLSVALARFVSKRLAVAQGTRLDRLVAALASDLADSRRAGTPRPAPSVGPTEKPT